MRRITGLRWESLWPCCDSLAGQGAGDYASPRGATISIHFQASLQSALAAPVFRDSVPSPSMSRDLAFQCSRERRFGAVLSVRTHVHALRPGSSSIRGRLYAPTSTSTRRDATGGIAPVRP